MTKHTHNQADAGRKPEFAERLRGGAVTAALLASSAMAGFGVASAFWDGLIRGDASAWIGLATIGAALLASETGAIVVAMAITRDGLTKARGFLFGVCTIGNMLAGHFGAEAINTRLVEPARAPYEQALANAEAAQGAAQNGLDAFESRAAGERAELERQIEAERAATPWAVSARGRTERAARESLATRQSAEREPLTQDLANAARDVATARAAMVEAPKGFDQLQMWGFAVLLELLKGVLVWVTAPRRHKVKPGQVIAITPAEIRNMDDAALEAAWESLGEARTLSTTLWHERRRRARRCA